jgi:hypothetical protein
VKVIHRGKPPSQHIWQGTCRSCESVVEAAEWELTNIQEDLREGTRFAWQKCIVCDAGDDKHNGYGGLLFYPRKVGI